MPTIKNGRILCKNDTSNNWETNNTILLNGEIGYDSTNKLFKIGDGSTGWNSLEYKHIAITEIDSSSFSSSELNDDIIYELIDADTNEVIGYSIGDNILTNKAGSSNNPSDTKLYLIGATERTSYGTQTYSNSAVYLDASNKLTASKYGASLTESTSSTTYSSIKSVIKTSSSGFSLSVTSVKDDDAGTTYTNTIKTSNSKLTIDVADLAITSAKNITNTASGSMTITTSNGFEIVNTSTSRLQISSGYSKLVGGYSSCYIYMESDIDINANGQLYLHSADDITLVAEDIINKASTSYKIVSGDSDTLTISSNNMATWNIASIEHNLSSQYVLSVVNNTEISTGNYYLRLGSNSTTSSEFTTTYGSGTYRLIGGSGSKVGIGVANTDSISAVAVTDSSGNTVTYNYYSSGGTGTYMNKARIYIGYSSAFEYDYSGFEYNFSEGFLIDSSEITTYGDIIPVTNTTYNLGSSSQKWKNIYATTFTGSLSGNATSATKLATARTINGTSFNGTSDIRLADYYTVALGATGNAEYYTMFATMSSTNTTGNGHATLLLSNVGNYDGTIQGSYLITISNRGSTPTMTATALKSHNSGTVVFGYYEDTDNGLFYFGMYGSAWQGSRMVTVLGSTGATISDFGDLSTAPDGWETIDINDPSESGTDVSFAQSLTSGTAVGTITIDGVDTVLYAPTNTNTTYSAGAGLSLSGTTFSLASVTQSSTTSTASPAHSGTFTVVDSVTTDSYGRVTAVNTKTITLPSDSNTTYSAGTGLSLSSTIFSLASVTQSDTTSTASPAHSGTFTTVDSVTRDSYGRVTGINVKTITLPSDNNTDTKVTNTVNTSGTKFYITGTTSSSTNTGTQIFDADIYVSSNHLYVPYIANTSNSDQKIWLTPIYNSTGDTITENLTIGTQEENKAEDISYHINIIDDLYGGHLEKNASNASELELDNHWYITNSGNAKFKDITIYTIDESNSLNIDSNSITRDGSIHITGLDLTLSGTNGSIDITAYNNLNLTATNQEVSISAGQDFEIQVGTHTYFNGGDHNIIYGSNMYLGAANDIYLGRGSSYSIEASASSRIASDKTYFLLNNDNSITLSGYNGSIIEFNTGGQLTFQPGSGKSLYINDRNGTHMVQVGNDTIKLRNSNGINFQLSETDITSELGTLGLYGYGDNNATQILNIDSDAQTIDINTDYTLTGPTATTDNDGLMSSEDKKNIIYFVAGTQTAATNAFTGVLSDVDALYDGLTINYWLPYSGTSTAATLNLTLSDGSTTGAIKVYINSGTGVASLTTHYYYGNHLMMTYRESVSINGTTYTGWFISDRNTDTYNRLQHNGTIKVGSSAITTGNIIVNNGSGYFHLKTGSAFDITYPILFANASMTASGTSSNGYLAMTFTVTTTQSITLTAYAPIFIQGTLSGTTFTPVSTTPLTQTIPTSEDGYEYIYLGLAYSTTAAYLSPTHDIYRYSDGSFQLIGSTDSGSEVSFTQSLTSGTKVGTITIDGTDTILYAPTNTNTTYSAGTGLSLSSTTFSLASVTQSDTTSTATATHSGTFTAIDSVTRDSYGRVTGVNTKTITLPSDNNTDTKVTNTLGTTTKFYITGTTSSSTNTGTQYFDTGVYVSTTAGQLVATSFSGSGASLTSLNASNISSGTLAAARLATSGVTSGSYGPSAAASPAHGGTFSVPYITVDSYGRITSATTQTITLPTDNNTTYSAATTTTAGLMSASDKSKLDAITASADSVTFTQSLTSGTAVGTITINGTDTVLYAPTDTNTHYSAYNYLGTSGATSNATTATTNTTTYLTLRENSSTRSNLQITGAGGTTVSAVNGILTITSTDTNTDTKVTNTASTGTKFYLTGTSSSSTNTGTQYFDTGIYTTTTAGQLVASTVGIGGTSNLIYTDSSDYLHFQAQEGIYIDNDIHILNSEELYTTGAIIWEENSILGVRYGTFDFNGVEDYEGTIIGYVGTDTTLYSDGNTCITNDCYFQSNVFGSNARFYTSVITPTVIVDNSILGITYADNFTIASGDNLPGCLLVGDITGETSDYTVITNDCICNESLQIQGNLGVQKIRAYDEVIDIYASDYVKIYPDNNIILESSGVSITSGSSWSVDDTGAAEFASINTTSLGLTYVVCSTAASTQAKAISITNFNYNLSAQLIAVYLENGNSNTNDPYLYINSTYRYYFGNSPDDLCAPPNSSLVYLVLLIPGSTTTSGTAVMMGASI